MEDDCDLQCAEIDEGVPQVNFVKTNEANSSILVSDKGKLKARDQKRLLNKFTNVKSPSPEKYRSKFSPLKRPRMASVDHENQLFSSSNMVDGSPAESVIQQVLIKSSRAKKRKLRKIKKGMTLKRKPHRPQPKRSRTKISMRDQMLYAKTDSLKIPEPMFCFSEKRIRLSSCYKESQLSKLDQSQSNPEIENCQRNVTFGDQEDSPIHS